MYIYIYIYIYTYIYIYILNTYEFTYTGISTLVGETRKRRYNIKHLNRKEKSEILDDEYRNRIEGLELVLKEDIYCIIIQATIRGFLLRKLRRRRTHAEITVR
jgi:hypothetical protein